MSESCNSNCGSCAQSCSSRKAPMDLRAQLAKESKVKKVIGIVSGKGGVGKSLTTTMMAGLRDFAQPSWMQTLQALRFQRPLVLRERLV